MLKQLLAASVLAAAGAGAQATVVYSNDFSSPPTVAPGVSAVFTAAGGGSQGTVAPYAATYGTIFRNDTTGLTQLTLSNLAPHTQVQVGFLLAFLDSWDSTNGSPAPDLLTFSIDGNPIGSYTYNNASGSVITIGGGTVVAQYVQFDTNQFYSDSVVDMSTDPALTFAHSANSLTLSWQAGGAGWQGSTDEAWGLDNLTVSVSGVAAVPEPSEYALLGAGLLMVGAVARRRNR